jgi:hypothetical protein
MWELGLDPDTNDFRKTYNPEEPRVLADHGEVSGQRTKGDVGLPNFGTLEQAGGEARGQVTRTCPVRLAFAQALAATEAAAALIAALGIATLFAGTIFLRNAVTSPKTPCARGRRARACRRVRSA